ncbi:MAG: hypothetical protein VW169_08115 [Rhodospirillaceae bacterium]|jgi:hypothetical protein
MATPPTPRGASRESLLLDYLHRLDEHKAGRRAVHVHVSRLEAQNRREHHVRLAADTFDYLVKMQLGQIFILKNSDIYFVYKGEAQEDVETAILKLRFLFSDDPMLVKENEESNQNFRTFFNVERDYDKMLGQVRSMIHAEEEREEKEHSEKSGGATDALKPKGEALSPRVLGRVIQALQSADMTNMVRRQFICGLIGKATPQPLFSELFISIPDLRETLMPGVDLGVSKWLFNYLTETLDRRMLAMLGRSSDQPITGEISVNLNVSTLLSPEFMVFDDSITAAMRGSVVVELQKVDIFSDVNAFFFAREFAKDRGYRICIDGLTHETTHFINREKLGADLIKLVWQKELNKDVGEGKVKRMLKSLGTSRVILCRCDDEQSVDFGHEVGISMFQGRHIENLIAEENRRREMEMARRRSQNTANLIDD